MLIQDRKKLETTLDLISKEVEMLRRCLADVTVKDAMKETVVVSCLDTIFNVAGEALACAHEQQIEE